MTLTGWVMVSHRAGGPDPQSAGAGAGEEAGQGGGRAAGEGEAGCRGGQGGAGPAGRRPDEDPGAAGNLTMKRSPLSGSSTPFNFWWLLTAV